LGYDLQQHGNSIGIAMRSCWLGPWSQKGFENALKPYLKDHQLKDVMMEWNLT
jgi:hypothetical protein